MASLIFFNCWDAWGEPSPALRQGNPDWIGRSSGCREVKIPVVGIPKLRGTQQNLVKLRTDVVGIPVFPFFLWGMFT